MKPVCVLSLFCLDFSKSKIRREVSRLHSGCTVIGPEKYGVGPSLLLGPSCSFECVFPDVLYVFVGSG